MPTLVNRSTNRDSRGGSGIALLLHTGTALLDDSTSLSPPQINAPAVRIYRQNGHVTPTVGVTYTSGSACNNTQLQRVDDTNNIFPDEPPDPTQYHLSGNVTPGGDTRILPSEVVVSPGENTTPLSLVTRTLAHAGTSKRRSNAVDHTALEEKLREWFYDSEKRSASKFCKDKHIEQNFYQHFTKFLRACTSRNIKDLRKLQQVPEARSSFEMALNSYFRPIRAGVASVTPPSTSSPAMTEAASMPVSVAGKSQTLAHSVGASEEFTPDTSEESLPLVPAIGEDGGGVRAAATADEMSFEHRVPGSTPDISEHKVDGRQSNRRKQDDMKRSSFLDPSFVKTHLRIFSHGGDNLKKYCTSNGIISN